MADVEFIHSSAGYISLMKSGAVRGELHSYANHITSAATAGMHPDKFSPELSRAPYYAFDFETSERAGVRIQTNNPHARKAEAAYGPLQNAAGV